ncbi:unnamed protein product [Aphanomyces euteiches]|uniref:LCCL domain-containing protein n=1 Tax=Aphanomyces euteiches TaxID=100861 RepID=A0A6G0WL29_9STRA|nr:hypothetical protein Ae201684_014077 [Aphanomyces euteiches]KAH9096346.1 hypothetical protein Ae201684P_009576 [Aphanomyces euteiches]KAH9145580.1 hypothetical protein AeRB84_010511 [Aphanomyces euteiches]
MLRRQSDDSYDEDGSPKEDFLMIRPQFKKWTRWPILHFGLFVVVSLSSLIILLYYGFFAAKVEGTTPAMIGCRNFAYWTGPTCGLNGIDCQPFESDWQPIRCPARCLWDGASNLQVFGSGPYRGDSRICRAAIHAGVIGSNGGCALMKYSGSQTSFQGSAAHGVVSTSFASWFPKDFEFMAAHDVHNCTDLTWWILIVGLLANFGLAIFPIVPPIVLIHTLAIWGYLYVSLVIAPTSYDYLEIVLQLATQVFFVIVSVQCMFHWFIKHTFASFASLSLMNRLFIWGVCYVLPFHILLHLSFFSFIPWLNIDLGGYKYDKVLNTAAYAVIIVGSVMSLVAIGFLLYYLYLQHKLRSTVVGYATLALYCVIVFVFFPHSILHVHHVMIGLILIPLTRVPRPIAFVTQAIGLGLYIQGYAAWGWPSFLETLPASFLIDVASQAPKAYNVTASSANITWESLENVYGYSLMLNGVMAYRGRETWTLLNGLQPKLTYFIQVSGVGDGGNDGLLSPEGNFTTLS